MNVLKNRMAALLLTLAVLAADASAGEYHVALTGSDANPGTRKAPFRTIQRAADQAQAGDTITVHAGVYRERVSPPRGGRSDRQRIIYQAAPGEKVVITGSEIADHWERVTNDTWRTTIPAKVFGGYNPYVDLIHGDWFDPEKRRHHTGAVYWNGDWLKEAATLDEVLKPAVGEGWWYGEAGETTTLWAQFLGTNPNYGQVEINVRPTVFTPVKTGINYLTIRGFDLRNAATPWAPPTAGQIGIISAYWCKGWIIENNRISYSKCSGVALGKYSDEWDNRAESAEGYVGALTRALAHGWDRIEVGSHLVRNNDISHCEQAGVVGSLGCSYSYVIGNVIHDIHVHQLFGGAEMAGIKFHGAIDVVIARNHIYRCGDVAGIWLDWMAQGAQVTGNLLHDNTGGLGDLFLEMQHGPILVANNLLLSPKVGCALNSQGVALVHNLIAGPILSFRADTRATPFQQPHSTSVAGLYSATNGDSGDHRLYNNLFIGAGGGRDLDQAVLPCFGAGNVFTRATAPFKWDAGALVETNFDAGVKLTEEGDGWHLTIQEDPAWRREVAVGMVTSALLGRAKVSGARFENGDGSDMRIDRDYFGHRRNGKHPFPGPFEQAGTGWQDWVVWRDIGVGPGY